MSLSLRKYYKPNCEKLAGRLASQILTSQPARAGGGRKEKNEKKLAVLSALRAVPQGQVPQAIACDI